MEELMMEAKVAVNEIEHPALRTEVLLELYQLGDKDALVRAKLEAGSVEDPALRAKVYREIAETGDVQALEAAYEAAQVITGLETRGRNLSEIAVTAFSIGQNDFAQKVFAKIEDPDYRAPVLIEKFKKGDKKAVSDARSEINRIEDPASRGRAFVALVQALSVAGESVLARETARLTDDPYFRSVALIEIMKASSKTGKIPNA